MSTSLEDQFKEDFADKLAEATSTHAQVSPFIADWRVSTPATQLYEAYWTDGSWFNTGAPVPEASNGLQALHTEIIDEVSSEPYFSALGLHDLFAAIGSEQLRSSVLSIRPLQKLLSSGPLYKRVIADIDTAMVSTFATEESEFVTPTLPYPLTSSIQAESRRSQGKPQSADGTAEKEDKGRPTEPATQAAQSASGSSVN